MEKNTLAAIGLSILVLVGFQYFQQKRTGEAKRAIQSRQAAAPPSSSPAAAVPAPSAAQPQTAEKPFQSVASANTGDTTAAPLSVTVEGPLYRAVLDNRRRPGELATEGFYLCPG